MKIDFTGGSEIVRNEIVLRKGQKIVTENGVSLQYRDSFRKGRIRWFEFADKDGTVFAFRMMAFPYLHAVQEPINRRDNLGAIDVRVSLVKHINRRLVSLLK